MAAVVLGRGLGMRRGGPPGGGSARAEAGPEEAMVGSSGVDRRKGTDADDRGYGRCGSLYSNGGRADGRTYGARVAASATTYH